MNIINLLRKFLTNSLYFYFSACAGAEYKNDDHHCWTGEKIGQYTQKVMSTGADAQRYNPEVPSLDVNSFTRSNKLSELVDKLIKLRHTIASAVCIRIIFSSLLVHVYL